MFEPQINPSWYIVDVIGWIACTSHDVVKLLVGFEKMSRVILLFTFILSLRSIETQDHFSYAICMVNFIFPVLSMLLR